MRIVLLSDDYLPDSTRNHAKMLHELGVELLRRGHQVTVITPADKNQQKLLHEDSIENIRIWRFRSSPFRGGGRVNRVLNETLLSFRAYFAIRKRLKAEQFDLCVNYSPSIFFGPLAKVLKSKGAFVYLVLRDFFPQWIIDEGMIREGSFAARYFRAFEHFNYRVADCVGVQSPANLKLFEEMYSKHKNVRVLMNWTQADVISEPHALQCQRSNLRLEGKVIFFYGGNIGHAQDMSNIMRLARSLSSDMRAHFLLVGQGDEFELVSRLKDEWKLDNVTILPSVSQVDYNQLLASVDIGLFSLSSRHSAHNFPGKLLGYMASKLPILGSVNLGNDVIETVNLAGAGMVTVNGNDDDFATNARRLLTDDLLRKKMGNQSAHLLCTTFSVISAADEILGQTIGTVQR